MGEILRLQSDRQDSPDMTAVLQWMAVNHLPGSAFQVLSFIAASVGGADAVFIPIKAFVDATRLNRNTITRAIDDLIDAGAIAVSDSIPRAYRLTISCRGAAGIDARVVPSLRVVKQIEQSQNVAQRHNPAAYPPNTGHISGAIAQVIGAMPGKNAALCHNLEASITDDASGMDVTLQKNAAQCHRNEASCHNSEQPLILKVPEIGFKTERETLSNQKDSCEILGRFEAKFGLEIPTTYRDDAGTEAAAYMLHLAGQGKLVDLRSPIGYLRSIIGKVPANWETAPVSDKDAIRRARMQEDMAASIRHQAQQQAHRKALDAWDSLPPAEREKWLARARERPQPPGKDRSGMLARMMYADAAGGGHGR